MSGNVRNCGLALPNGPSSHTGLFAEMSALPLWYNASLPRPPIPKPLEPYVRGIKYLSTKQVPSCLLLRCSGSSSVTKNRDTLLRCGFTLREHQRESPVERDLTVRRTVEGLLSPSGSLAEILMDSAEVSDIIYQDDGIMLDSESETSGSETEDSGRVIGDDARKSIRFRKDSRYRMKYDDPWKIHAGYRLGDMLGYNPDITVWSGDGVRLQDPLPAKVLGPNWDGSKKSKVRFNSIVAHDVKLHVVYKHTHWGQALKRMCNEPGPLRSWSRTLRSRINRFLSGSTDPCCSKGQLKALFEEHTVSIKARASRFIEMLKTVDGVFLQRYLCYPEEVWTWDRFDRFTLGNISFLIGDEFLDGVLTEKGASVNTAYSQLKAARKWFKEAAHSDNLEHALSNMGETPSHWCRQFANVWKRADTEIGPRRTYVIGVLSQTRGCGTPPPLVILQSKVKFLKTISLKRPEEPRTARLIRRAALEEVLNELDDSAFTGLSTKSRITVSTSSSWEKTRREGGTIEAARELLATLPIGEGVPVRDLHTGRIESYKSKEYFDSTGEVVFWLALDHVLRTPPEELKYAFLTMVKEPGKARTVTKARACLKIVLDLVNKLVSGPLEKGIRSSTSGMGKANHGWNLFCRLMSDEVRDMVFSLDSREEDTYEGYVERTDTFKALFMSSTDYESATDQMRHEMGSDLGQAWMLKCGIPPVLRGIVQKTCYQPRQVFFNATGVLNNFGTPRPDMGTNIRSVTMVTGILMGDPLTKVALHLTNVVTRRIGARLFDADFYDKFSNGSQSAESFREGFARRANTPTIGGKPE